MHSPASYSIVVSATLAAAAIATAIHRAPRCVYNKKTVVVVVVEALCTILHYNTVAHRF